MTKETDLIQQKLIRETPVDDADRRLLGVLVEDAGVSYAELGARAGLSASQPSPQREGSDSSGRKSPPDDPGREF